MRQETCATAMAWLLLGGLAAAQPVPPPGREFRVNSYTTDIQEFSSASADGRGNYVVAWTDFTQDGSGAGIFARRLSASGRRLGPAFQVNAYTTGTQQLPTVAAAPDGRALVVWFAVEDDRRGAFAHRLDAGGRPVGDDFRVDTSTTGFVDTIDVAADESGGFLVTWACDTQTACARRIPASGSPTGGEFVLGDFRVFSTAHQPGGGFVTLGDRSAADDVWAMLLDEGGAPAGPLFQVNTYTTGYQTSPSVAVDGTGSFVVAWYSRRSAFETDAMARRYDRQGQALGAEFKVNPDDGHPALLQRVAIAPDGGFIVAWTDEYGFDWDVRARRYDASGLPRGADFKVNEHLPYLQLFPAVAASATGQYLVVWDEADLHDISARQFGMIPTALRVDPATAGGNGVLEAGEAVDVAPSWANRDQADWTVDGTAVGFTGPGSPTAYSIPDPSAGYGFIADGDSASCETSGGCYRVALASAARPASHWDATLHEQLSNGFGMNWTLHVGGSFTDVPATTGYYRSIETLLHNGVTAGCASAAYCPAAMTTREQMAAFVLTGAEGAGYRPRACTAPVFGDVPASSGFCPYVEELARRGVVAGCGGGLFCPGAPVTRAETAVFVLRTLEGTPAPPDCGTPLFADVPASSPYCRWIEELARRGVVAGCGGGNYCPDAAVTREEMAVFISSGFGLALYAP